MQSRYGHLWASAYPTQAVTDAAINEWAELLGGLTGEQIKRGLDSWNSRMPPNVYEFRECCKMESSPAHRQYIALPKPKADEKIAASAFEQMKMKLRVKASE